MSSQKKLHQSDAQLLKTSDSTAKPKYTLEELCAGITPENIQREIDWGPPVGKEIW